MKKFSTAMITVGLVFATPAVALAASNQYIITTTQPTASNEIWVDTTIINNGPASGTENQYYVYCQDGSNDPISQFGWNEDNVGGTVTRTYFANLDVYNATTHTNQWIPASVNNPSISGTGQTVRLFTRSYANSGSPTGYDLDANMSDSGSHTTGLYNRASGTGTGFPTVRTWDTQGGCNTNSSHVYTNAWYKSSSSGLFVRWVGTDSGTGSSGCGLTPTETGSLISGGSATLKML